MTDPANEQAVTEDVTEEVVAEPEAGTPDPSEALTTEHPRFKEVYGKWKTTEREMEAIKKSLAEKDSDIELMRQHNQRLAESVSSVRSEVEERKAGPPPNINEDPEGYAAYMETKLTKQQTEYEGRLERERLAMQIDLQKDLHEDYDIVVKSVMAEMERNPTLRAEIYGQSNPAKAAYQHGRKKMDTDTATKQEQDQQAAKERDQAVQQGQVEGGGKPPVKTPGVTLTDEQKRVAAKFRMTEKDYAAQLKAMGAV